jgi:hypothetical protein
MSVPTTLFDPVLTSHGQWDILGLDIYENIDLKVGGSQFRTRYIEGLRHEHNMGSFLLK